MSPPGDEMSVGTAARLGHMLETRPDLEIPWPDEAGRTVMRPLRELVDEADAEIAGAELIAGRARQMAMG
jgi:hypothetical protein